MNPNQALWEKGDFTRIAESMRESGEALVAELGDHEGHEGARSRLRRRHDRRARGAARRRGARASISRATWSRPANGARKELGLVELHVSARRRVAICSDLKDGPFDLVVSIFGAMFAPKPFDVAKEMVRVDPPRRSDRDGKLDPERSDPGRADPEDQLRLFAAAPGRLRQPDDLGRREPCDRAIRRPRASRRSNISFAAGHLHLRRLRRRRRSSLAPSGNTTGQR